MTTPPPTESNRTPALAPAPPSNDEALSYWIGLSRLIHQVRVMPDPTPTADECALVDQPRRCVGGTESDLSTFTRCTIHRVLICCGIKQHRVRQSTDHMLAQLLSAAYTTTASPSASAPAMPVVCLDRASLTSTSPTSPLGQLPVPLADLVADWLSRSSADDQGAPQGNRYSLWVPAVMWNKRIVKCLGSDLRGQMISLRPLFRWNMACAQQTGRLPVVIFVGGTSGAGKSTLASLVASHLRITNVLSTDTVRQVLRVRLRGQEAQYPALFVSTYEAHKVTVESREVTADSEAGVLLNEEHINEDAIVQAYEVQCRLVLRVLDGMLARLLARRESIVVEGVHLLPKYLAAKRAELLVSRVACVPVVVCIPKADSHLERFCVRARGMSMQAHSNKYIASFNAIRTIQSHLVNSVEAASLPVLVLSNTNVDKSFTMLHHSLLETMEYPALHGWPTDEAAAAKVPLTRLGFTAVKNRLVMVVRQQRHLGGRTGHNLTATRGVGAYSVRDEEEGNLKTDNSCAPIPGPQLRLPAHTPVTKSKNGAAPRARSAEMLGVVQRCLLEQGLRYHTRTNDAAQTDAATACAALDVLGSGVVNSVSLSCRAALRYSTTDSLSHISASLPSHFLSDNRNDEFDEVEVPSLIGS
ncbi:hypothetical protein JKF63_06867 [Porcisia hertigi]|uniref:Zeta toxin domain-containing protein n=1 Tax=Porcisia hertigi TaxID=2761500 RepID=A0A836YG09_9TRYP|nr:hypothetical protein JKF63_06867 [Porcisia hertigi]